MDRKDEHYSWNGYVEQMIWNECTEEVYMEQIVYGTDIQSRYTELLCRTEIYTEQI